MLLAEDQDRASEPPTSLSACSSRGTSARSAAASTGSSHGSSARWSCARRSGPRPIPATHTLLIPEIRPILSPKQVSFSFPRCGSACLKPVVVADPPALDVGGEVRDEHGVARELAQVGHREAVHRTAQGVPSRCRAEGPQAVLRKPPTATAPQPRQPPPRAHAAPQQYCTVHGAAASAMRPVATSAGAQVPRRVGLRRAVG